MDEFTLRSDGRSVEIIDCGIGLSMSLSFQAIDMLSRRNSPQVTRGPYRTCTTSLLTRDSDNDCASTRGA